MAQIVKAELLMFDLAPKVVRTDAIQSFVNQETPILQLTDADGTVGTGYSYTIGPGGPAVISLLHKTLLPALIGRDGNEIDGVWRDLLYATHATSVGAITSLALATIDTALWDLRCLNANQPLWRMAGGAKRYVPLYTTEGGWLHIETDKLVSDALAMQAKGFGGAKIKIGKPTVAEDRARLRAVREVVGDEFNIFVDANQSFSLSEAMSRADMLSEFGIGWFEEPMKADDIGAHVRLNGYSRVPIAVGESLYSLIQFKDFVHMDGCSIVQADVARVGGITPWLKIAHMAESFNISICPHFLMELHVSLPSGALPNAPMLEFIPQLDDITNSRLDIRDGVAHAPMEPGLGIDWNWDAIRDCATPGISTEIGG